MTATNSDSAEGGTFVRVDKLFRSVRNSSLAVAVRVVILFGWAGVALLTHNGLANSSLAVDIIVAAVVACLIIFCVESAVRLCILGGHAGMALRHDGVLVRNLPSKNSEVSTHDRFVPWSELRSVRIDERSASRGLGPPTPRYFLVLHLADGGSVRTIGVAVRKEWQRNLLDTAYREVEDARRTGVAGKPSPGPPQSDAERGFREAADREGVDLGDDHAE